MWLKLVLLIIYVAILFILARLLEAVTWVESGQLSRRLLDPMTLSVLKLKALLEQRGVNYETAVEKQDLTELVEATGVVTEEEVEESSYVDVSTVTNFTAGSHFLEQVEDAKDSVWLVQVHSDQNPFNHVINTCWKAIKYKMDRFGVRVGHFDCKLDRRFCYMKGWDSSRLILGLPQNFESKSQVTLHTYVGSYKTQHVYKWIKNTVSQKVYLIESDQDLLKNWLEYRQGSKLSEVRIVMVSEADMMPLFYSALSVKFPGRVKFGFMSAGVLIKNYTEKVGFDISNSTYIVITNEKIFNYGCRPAESITFKSMDIFLRSLYPSLNDIFVTSLIVCNCLTFFELSLVHGSIFKRLIKYLWCAVKFNMALLLLWMVILTVFQLQFLSGLVEYGLRIVRFIGGSDFMSSVKADNNFYYHHPVIVQILFVLYLVLVGYFHSKQNDNQTEADTENSLEWNFAQFRTLEHLFYPIQPRSLMNRNSMAEWNQQEIPSLWAAVHMSTEYIHLLPVWGYSGKAQLNSDVEENDASNPTEGSAQADERLTQTDKIKKLPFKERLFQENASETNESEVDNEEGVTKGRNKGSEKAKESLESDIKARSNADISDGYLQGTQCVICLDNYSEGVSLCGLPCGHCFHRKCIVVWLMRDNHYCPICRWPSNKPKIEMHLHSE